MPISRETNCLGSRPNIWRRAINATICTGVRFSEIKDRPETDAQAYALAPSASGREGNLGFGADGVDGIPDAWARGGPGVAGDADGQAPDPIFAGPADAMRPQRKRSARDWDGLAEKVRQSVEWIGEIRAELAG